MALEIPVINHPTLKYITYRNTIVEMAHPHEAAELIILATNPDIRFPLEVKGKPASFFTSAIKSWRAFYGADLPERYGEVAEDAVYMGILFTTNRFPPINLSLKVRVVEDGEYGTGDCHGLVSKKVMEELYIHDWAAQEHRRPAKFPPGNSRVAQFRMVVPDKHLVKGTIREANIDVDIILPISSFKGNKPELGIHGWAPWLGIRDWAQPRVYRLGYQVWQYIPWNVLQKDVPLTQLDACILDDWDRDAILEHLGPIDGRDVFFEQVISRDEWGVSLRHPGIARKVQQAYRNKWHDLATNGGITGTGLMGIPDDSLEDDTVATNDMPIGDVIITRYPLRGPQDVKVVKNVGIGAYEVPRGCVAMSHKTALTMAGDFDGDIFVVKDGMPHVRSYLKSRDLPEPFVKEKVRRRTPWNQRVKVFNRAARLSSQIAIIANLITRAWASGAQQAVQLLGQQLQIAVDGIKYDGELDMDLIETLSREIPQVPWLQDHKRKDMFVTSPPERSGWDDTISHFWNIAADHFTPLRDRALSWDAFRKLVPEPKPAIREISRVMAWRLYLGPIAALNDIPEDERQEAVAEICNRLRRWADGEDAMSEGKVLPGLAENREQFFQAFWHIGCDRRSSVCFIAFPNESIDAFAELEPKFVIREGLKCKDGRIISWAAAQPVIDALPSDRRERLNRAIAQLL